MRTVTFASFLWLLVGCSGQPDLPELPPLQEPSKPPLPDVVLVPSISDVELYLTDKNEVVAEVVDETAGSLIHFKFTYLGEFNLKSDDWSPEGKRISIRIGKPKNNAKMTISSSMNGNLKAKGKGRFEVVVPVRQSIRPGDYQIVALLAKDGNFAGELATCRLTVNGPQTQ